VTVVATGARSRADKQAQGADVVGMTSTTRTTPGRTRGTTAVHRVIPAEPAAARTGIASRLGWSALSALTFCLVAFYAAQALRVTVATVDELRGARPAVAAARPRVAMLPGNAPDQGPRPR
jgi:hypothetical protein